MKGWGLLTNAALLEKKYSYLMSGNKYLQMKETYPPVVSWVDEVRKFLALQTLMEKKKDWGIDELHNTLRRFRDDKGESLATHIETRQEKSYAPAAS